MDNRRLKKLQSSIRNPILIKKKENLLYLTGRSFMHGYLLVKPLRRHSEAGGRRILNHGKGSFAGAQDDAIVFFGDGLERVDGIKSDFLKNVGKYISRGQTLEVFGEFTYAEVKYIRFKNKNLRLKITVKHDPVDFERQVKDANEIQYVKKSMRIVGKVFGQVKNQLRRSSAGHRPALSEIKLAEFIKQAGFKLGAEDISFPPIVASGANAAIPHHVPSSKRLKAGESIIIDFGFKYKNYCSDFTRTVFLHHAPKKLAEAYNQTEKAYNESIEFISSSHVIPEATSGTRAIRNLKQDSRFRGNDKGVTGGQVYQKSVDVLAEKNLAKYFIHSLGHGTGLEIHELPNLSPNSRDILQDGMVFSIEPGVYIPKVGGVRIEDLVYLPRSDTRSVSATRGLEKGRVKKFIKVPTKLKDNIL